MDRTDCRYHARRRRYPDDERRQECVSVNQNHNSTDGFHVVSGCPLHDTIPRDAGLHGRQDADDDQDDRGAEVSGAACERDQGELGCDVMRIAEIFDRAPRRSEPVSRRIGGDRLRQMIFHFLPHAS
jgi:hypothetical protein